MEAEVNEILPIEGAKNKGAGGYEAPNSLRSDSVARIVDLISEGPIKGLVNGEKSVFFDQTAVVNLDGIANINGVIDFEFRNGLPDQAAFLGNPTTETPFSVQTQVKYGVPIIHTISDDNVTAVRVVIQIPILAQTDGNGNILAFQTAYSIDVQPAGGAFTQALNNVVYGKNSSPYFVAHRVELPAGGAPWNIQVRRTVPDNDGNDKLQNDTYWDSYSELVEGNFIYPNSAVAFTQINAAYFGSGSVPARSYDIYGLLVNIPSNYDGRTRVYNGIWNGSFKIDWTNNPAWVLYDLIVNDRYGLGEFVDASKIDKWSLYQIAQYCDQLVPDGFGGTEPRYTFNGVIANRDEAFKVLQQITTAFRGMAYWSLGQVFAFADMPADPVKLVSPANIIDGHFEYSGTAMKARHSVAVVNWNDPLDFYQSAVELVIDEDMLKRFGWRETSIMAVGCTSRGLAHRYGKWLLDTEKNSTETVEYTASWDHADVRPGDIIAVADPNKAEVRLGGRIAALGDAGVYTLDAAFEPTTGQTYNLMAELPDGSVATAPIHLFAGAVVTVVPDFTTRPIQNAMWVITGTDIVPRQYRIVSISEDSDGKFKVVSLFHDPTKYARVEQGVQLDPIPYSRPTGTILPPTNVAVQDNLYFDNGTGHSRLLLSWTPGSDFLAKSYAVSAQTPSGYQDFGLINGTSFDLDDATPGDYVFSVSSVSVDSYYSPPVTATITAQGWAGSAAPTVTDLQIFGRGTDLNFGGVDCHVTWTNNFPGDDVAGSSNASVFYRDNVIQVYDLEGALLRTETVSTPNYVYTLDRNTQDNASLGRGAQRSFKISVSVRDSLGRQSAPVTITPVNPVPATIIPTVAGSMNLVFVDYVRPTDLDFIGCLVWVSSSPTFDPLATTPMYQGVNNSLSFPEDPGPTGFATYYVRLAGYDAFGTTDLNISPVQSVQVGNQFIDTTPPDLPTNVVLTPIKDTLPTGEVQSDLIASWDASTSANFAYFEAAISEQGGNYILTPTSLPTIEWRGLIAGLSYAIKVRAVSQNGFKSAFTTPISITMPLKTTPPGAPTNLAVVASLKSAYLSWTNAADTDLASTEIWAGPNATQANAVKVGTVAGNAFTHSGLATGTAVFYWLRAINTSGIKSAFTTTPVSVTPGQVASGDIAANAITADKIVAGSITGDKLNINTTLPATITIGDTGVAIGGLTNPAALINANTTLIAPGLVQISGTTTLSSWRDGTDATKIAGGSIAANSIAANQLTIGLRGLDISGLSMTYNATTGLLSLGAGTITFITNAGTPKTVELLAATPIVSPSSTFYVSWSRSATTLTVGTVKPTDVDTIVFATYTPATGLIVTYGRTQVDGSAIVSNSISAAQIIAGAITADKIAVGAITANKIAAGAITADLISGGTISAATGINIGGTQFVLDAANQRMFVKDQQATPVTRVVIGKIGTGPSDYGINIYDAGGNLALSSGGALNFSQITSLNNAVGTLSSNAQQGGGGGNLVPNSEMVDLTGFNAFSSVATGNTQSLNFPGYFGTGVNVIYTSNSGSPATGQYADWYTPISPVSGNINYEHSALAAYHRAAGTQIFVQFLDAAGAHIIYLGGEQGGALYGAAGGVLTNFQQIGGFTTSPANAAFARIIMRVLFDGEANPFGFFTHPFIRAATAGQTVLSSYSAGPPTDQTTALAQQAATITQQAQTIGNLGIKYSLIGSINGVTGGFILSGIQQNDGGVVFGLEIDANVTINGGLIVNGTVSTSQIALNAVTNIATATGAGTTNVSMNCRGYPVIFQICYDGGDSTSVFISNHVYVGGFMYVQIDGVNIKTPIIPYSEPSTSTSNLSTLAAMTTQYIYTPTPGVHTFGCVAGTSSGAGSAPVNILVMEIAR